MTGGWLKDSWDSRETRLSAKASLTIRPTSQGVGHVVCNERCALITDYLFQRLTRDHQFHQFPLPIQGQAGVMGVDMELALHLLA